METLSETNYLSGNINGNVNSLSAVHVEIHYRVFNSYTEANTEVYCNDVFSQLL